MKKNTVKSYIVRKKAAALWALLLAGVMLFSSGCGVRTGTETTAAPATDEPVVINTDEPVNTDEVPATDVDPGDATSAPDPTPEATEVVPTETTAPTETAADVTDIPATETGAPTETPTEAPTATPTPTPTPTATPTPTKTPTPTPTQRPTATPTQHPSATPTSQPDSNLAKYSGLVISKVYGNGGNTTSACEHSFIELKNTGTTSLKLGGLALYYKSGETTDYTSFALPDVTLNAGKTYLIRCASASKSSVKYDTTYEVIRINNYDTEWNVSLNNKEIRLVLSFTGKKFSKTTQPAELNGKISYFVATDSYYFDTGYVSDYSKNKVAVRVADKQDSGWYLQNLTKTTTEKLAQIVPVTMNGKAGTIIGSKLTEVKFSTPAGFYTSPVKLTLTPPAGYDTVYYTLDGSDPTTSNTRRRHTSAFTLSDTTSTPFGSTYTTGLGYVGNIRSATSNMLGAHVVKACAYDGKNYTGVYTNTYIISSSMANYGVTVMSITLEKNQMFGNPGFYHNFNASSNDPNTRGKAFLEVFDKNGTRRGYSNVELSISGHGSSGTGMRSMKVFLKGSDNTTDGTDSKLNFDLFDGYATNSKGQCITDFSRLLLRNSGNDCGVSYIRDAYMQRVSRVLNIDTMAYAPVLVFINGDFWGVYNARERYSGDYVQSHYGINKDNVALIESDYSQVHTNQNAPFIVSSGLDNDADDFNQLVNFIKSNNMSVATNYEYVCSKLDIDSFIDMYVSRLYFSARDWPENNIKVWRNRATNDPSGFDNKWHFTLLDMDMGISFFTDGNNTTENSNFFGWIDATNCVVGNIMHALRQNATFKRQFMARFYQVLNELYVPSWMEEELDVIVAQRAPLLTLQSQRWGANTNTYNTSVANMRKFVRNRYSYAVNYLCSYFGVSESYLKSISGNYLTMSFSETRLNVKVDGTSVSTSWVKKFDSSITVTVTATAKTGFELIAIVFTDSSGKVTRYTGGTAQITTTKAGEITFETKKQATAVDLSVHSGIVAGGCQMYYLTPEGKLYAWGNNNNNVLGAGTSLAQVTTPKLVRENVAQIEVCHSNDLENSNNNIMAAILTLDGDIYTIGAGTVSGVTTTSSGWTLLEYDGMPVAISVGFDHMLILDKDGTVWGIGNNNYGQLGKANAGGSVTSFQKIATGATMISAGRRNSAYVDSNGDCYVLGDARWNKFRESTDNITTPYKLLSGVSYITSGEHEMLLVTEDGKLYYAGWRTLEGFGQGGGSFGAKQLSISGVAKAAIHFGDIAILTESGALYGYGINSGNCIGGNVTGGAPTLLIRSGVRDVAAGMSFIAYVDSNGNIKVNGSNTDGQAGNGTTSEYVSWATANIK